MCPKLLDSFLNLFAVFTQKKLLPFGDWIFLYLKVGLNRGPGNVVGIATGYGLDGPEIEPRFSAHIKTGPGAHPASCTMGTGSFPEVKSGRGVTLTPHPLLVPWSIKGRAIPLFPLRAVRPIQSLTAFTSVHFTFTLRLNHIKPKPKERRLLCTACQIKLSSCTKNINSSTKIFKYEIVYNTSSWNLVFHVVLLWQLYPYFQ